MHNLTYVFDAYCGWCYGFSAAISELDRDADTAVTVLPGALFSGPRAGRIGDFPHIPQANARISELTGASFGEDYQRLVREGDFVMRSDDAAVGFTAMTSVGGLGLDVRVAAAMQSAFYRDGLSLSDIDTYRRIATALGLDDGSATAALGSTERC